MTKVIDGYRPLYCFQLPVMDGVTPDRIELNVCVFALSTYKRIGNAKKGRESEKKKR